jgi:hypothetical protein
VEDKFKTTIVVPQELHGRIAELSDQLGISRSAVINLGSAMAVIELGRLIKPGRRRAAILRDAQGVFQKILDKAEKH